MMAMRTEMEMEVETRVTIMEEEMVTRTMAVTMVSKAC